MENYYKTKKNVEKRNVTLYGTICLSESLAIYNRYGVLLQGEMCSPNIHWINVMA